jgi:Xaa-Pro aminopeptidase
MTARSAEQIRRERAAPLLRESGLDALLVTNLHNVRYLTGFTGSNAAVLLYRDRQPVLFTDPRYTIQAKDQTNCRTIVAKGSLIKAVMQQVRKSRPSTIGFESDHLTVSQFESLKKAPMGRTQLRPSADLIQKLRMIKDENEAALIRASVVSNSRALDAALKRFKIGMTESDFAAEIDFQNRKLGADGPAFDTIVAAGNRAALPHAHPAQTRIGPGILLIDMGAFRGGYASDMTRTLYVGRAPAKYKNVYRAVLEAQLAAIDAIRPGVSTSSVDRAARNVMKTKKLDREFVHSTGHGLGLEIHEPPRIGRNDKTKLQAGMAITIEPGVYIEGWGGIRIEDTVLVTANGCEILTPTSKELREIS